MCGINGVYKYSGNHYPEEIIERMNKTLAHRGPDASGVYRDDFIHLGHQRLSIIDLSEDSNQPFSSPDGRYTLVFNGEIYNYKSIRAQLNDYSFQTEGDTEVVLAAYLQYGENCLQLFNGMFAFAIWDREKKSLFLARDRMGIKPLYYVLTNEELIFSSSLKSILATGLIEKKLSERGLVDYLRYQTVHAPYTIIEGVFMLLPGQKLLLTEESEPKFTHYWKMTRDFRSAGNSVSDVKETIRQKLIESVERRMVADVPFGAFLSGGVDSSLLVALMREVGGQKLDTFSVGFKEETFSELQFAKQVADRYQTQHHEIILEANTFKDLIPEGLRFMDHPSGDGLNTYVVSKKTREAGIKMALSGLGGDELFGGYSVFQQIPELQSKKWLNSFAVNFRKPMGYLYHKMKGTVASAKIAELMKLPTFDTEYAYQFYRQVILDHEVGQLMNLKELPENSVLHSVHEKVGFKKEGWGLPPLSRISVAEISTYMQNVLLRDSDQMSMANGLELRVPFMDHELVSYALGIRDEIKRPIPPKQLLISAFEDLLPKEVYQREKMGFVLPYEKWMQTELKSFCDERLNELKKIKYFREKGVDAFWQRFLNNDKQVSWSRIWPLVTLGDWIKENGITG